MEPETKPRPNRDVHGSNGSDGGHNNRHSLSCPLTREESYQNDHLTHAAFVSIAILTFITFVGNFTQLQLSSALPIIVSEFHISVTTGQWLTSVFQLVMGVMVPLTAFLTRRFSTRPDCNLLDGGVHGRLPAGMVGAKLRMGAGRARARSCRHGRDVAGAADHGVFPSTRCPDAALLWAPWAWP